VSDQIRRLALDDFGLLLQHAHNDGDDVMVQTIADALLGDLEARAFCREVLAYRESQERP
jgi:hypothetical protein